MLKEVAALGAQVAAAVKGAVHPGEPSYLDMPNKNSGGTNNGDLGAAQSGLGGLTPDKRMQRQGDCLRGGGSPASCDEPKARDDEPDAAPTAASAPPGGAKPIAPPSVMTGAACRAQGGVPDSAITSRDDPDPPRPCRQTGDAGSNKQASSAAQAKSPTAVVPPVPLSQANTSCSDITGTGAGHPSYSSCNDANKTLERARKFRKEYPSLKDSDKQVTGWAELYRHAAAEFRVAGDAVRASRLDEEAAALDVEPFVKAERDQTIQVKRGYHLKEAEEEYLRGSAVMGPDNKPSCYDANFAADLFEMAGKDFAAAGDIGKSEESNSRSIAIRKQINDGLKGGKCTLAIGPKPNPLSLQKIADDLGRGKALYHDATSCHDATAGADLVEASAKSFANVNDERSKAAYEQLDAIRKELKARCPDQGTNSYERDQAVRMLRDKLKVVSTKYKRESCEYMNQNPQVFSEELIGTACKE